MRKRYVMIGIIGIMILITGICYSCSYQKAENSSELIADLSEEEQNVAPNNELTDTSSDALIDQLQGDTSVDAAEKLALAEGIQKEQRVSDQEKPMDYYVHLCGEVVRPGVYQVPASSRVIDIIRLAGGLTEAAAGDYVNQAQLVSDGQRIYIPNQDEVKELSLTADIPSGASVQGTSSTDKKLININQADVTKLMELPGIGEAKAASIIEYRSVNGSFESIEDLMKIPGIKEGLFNKLAPYITVR
jgi:competence protein ComEA